MVQNNSKLYMEWWSESWWNTTETPLEVTMCSYQWCTNRTTNEVVLMNTIMSRDKLLARGYCCGMGCRNCPYDPPHQRNNTKVMSRWKVLFEKIITYLLK